MLGYAKRDVETILQENGLNTTIGSDDYNEVVRNIEATIANESFFVRVIISLTTCLAIIALLFRNWLYTFWIDFKSSK